MVRAVVVNVPIPPPTYVFVVYADRGEDETHRFCTMAGIVLAADAGIQNYVMWAWDTEENGTMMTEVCGKASLPARTGARPE